MDCPSSPVPQSKVRIIEVRRIRLNNENIDIERFRAVNLIMEVQADRDSQDGAHDTVYARDQLSVSGSIEFEVSEGGTEQCLGLPRKQQGDFRAGVDEKIEALFAVPPQDIHLNRRSVSLGWNRF